MGKIRIKNVIIFVLAFFVLSLIPVFADSDVEVIELQSVHVSKNKTDEIELKLVTDKPFLTKPILFEKTKDIYFISLPATTYKGSREIDVENISPIVKSITVDFIPYKSHNGEGYTRIIMNSTTKPLVVNTQSEFEFPVAITLIVVLSVILIILISYLSFVLYTKLKRRAKKSRIELDDYREIEQLTQNAEADEIPNDTDIETTEDENFSTPDDTLSADTEEIETISDEIDTISDEISNTFIQPEKQEPQSNEHIEQEENINEITEFKPEETQEQNYTTPLNQDEDIFTDKQNDTVNAEFNENLPIPADEIVHDILNDENVLDEISDTIASDNENLIENISNEQDITENNIENQIPQENEPSTETAFEADEHNDIVQNSLEDILSENNDIEEIQQVDELDELLPDNYEENTVSAQDESILDEVLGEKNDLIKEPIEAEPILDDILSDNYELSADADKETQIEQPFTEQKNNDFKIVEFNQISAGSTGFSNQSFDLTAKASPQEEPKVEEIPQDELSPFDALGFGGMISGEIEPDNSFANDLERNIQSDDDFVNTDFDIELDSITEVDLSENKTPITEENQTVEIEETNEPATETQPQEITQPQNSFVADETNIEPEFEEPSQPTIEQQFEAEGVEEPAQPTIEQQFEAEVVEEPAQPTIEQQFEAEVVEEPSQPTIKQQFETEEVEEPVQPTIEQQIETEGVEEPAQPTIEQQFEAEEFEQAKNSFFAEETNEYSQVEEEYERPVFDPRPVDISSFFTDTTTEEEEKEDYEDIPENIDNFFEEEDDSEEEPPIVQSQKAQPIKEDKEIPVDDSEPLVLDKKDFSKSKSLYLLRHNGEFSLVATVNDDVFVIERFEEIPSKQEIILKHNEKRAKDDVYIAKVGNWRALLSVSKDSVKNILTL